MKKFNNWKSEKKDSLHEFFWNKKPQADPCEQYKKDIYEIIKPAGNIVANIERLPVYQTDANLKKLVASLKNELFKIFNM